MSLALRNLLRERTRLAISVGGIAFAVTLIVLVRGLFVAYQTRVADYFDGVDTDLWVLQSGTADFFHSFSLLPIDLRTGLACRALTVFSAIAEAAGPTLNNETFGEALEGLGDVDLPGTGTGTLGNGKYDALDDLRLWILDPDAAEDEPDFVEFDG